MSSRSAPPSAETLSAEFAWMRGRRWVGVPMARHTSLRVGGPADIVLVPANLEELQVIVSWAYERGIPLTCIGNGTNLIVRSGGIRGIVVWLRQALNHLSLIEPIPSHHVRPGDHDVRPGDPVRVRVGAGVPLTRLLHFMIRQGLMGLAFAVGIPGTMGGAIVTNAGTEVGNTWDVIDCVRLLLPDGQIITLGRRDVTVGYRYVDLPRRAIILEAILVAVKGNGEEIREEVRRLYRCRLQTQPLSMPNAGSIFKNPPGERAGRLIDHIGLKGYRIGDAQVSRKHANFIVNLNQASAEEVLALVEHVKHHVYAHVGISLEEEVHIVGE